jgi:LPXTG-motif cell wall-anchored protein
MQRLATRLWVAVGTVGGIVTIAAQTKPDDAISNLGAWAKIVGIDGAVIPAGVDTWATIFGVAMMLAALGAWWFRRRQKSLAPTASEPKSPIEASDTFFADCDHVIDETGNEIEGVYSVAVCLWVSNGMEDGSPLKNVQARYYHPSGEWIVLPVRGQTSSVVDIRHGESALIEIGRMLWRQPSDSNSIPAMPRAGGKRMVPSVEILETLPPTSPWRSFAISDALGGQRSAVGQTSENLPFTHMQIILSADGVISRYLRLQTNLYDVMADKWLSAASTENGNG